MAATKSAPRSPPMTGFLFAQGVAILVKGTGDESSRLGGGSLSAISKDMSRVGRVGLQIAELCDKYTKYCRRY